MPAAAGEEDRAPWFFVGLETLWRSLVSGWKDPVFRTLAVAVLSILAIGTLFWMRGPVTVSAGHAPDPLTPAAGAPSAHVDGSAANSDNSTRD
jgi:hypothetical protein